jgi:hypothetical protein
MSIKMRHCLLFLVYHPFAFFRQYGFCRILLCSVVDIFPLQAYIYNKNNEFPCLGLG